MTAASLPTPERDSLIADQREVIEAEAAAELIAQLDNQYNYAFDCWREWLEARDILPGEAFGEWGRLTADWIDHLQWTNALLWTRQMELSTLEIVGE